MKKNLFQSFLILVSIFISSNVVRSEEELRMSASEKLLFFIQMTKKIVLLFLNLLKTKHLEMEKNFLV